jgi:geranylgeranyl pyrophosphate synthase
VERARGLVESTGALDETVALIKDLVARAKEAVDRDVVPARAASLLAEMADVVAVRRL